jgi:hypothetical protein
LDSSTGKVKFHSDRLLALKQASCGLLNIAPWKNLENFHKISQSHTLPPLDESLKRLWTVIFEQDGQFGPICHV